MLRINKKKRNCIYKALLQKIEERSHESKKNGLLKKNSFMPHMLSQFSNYHHMLYSRASPQPFFTLIQG